MCCGLPFLASTITWRERSASTCLPPSGHLSLNPPLPAASARKIPDVAFIVRSMLFTLRKASTARPVPLP